MQLHAHAMFYDGCLSPCHDISKAVVRDENQRTNPNPFNLREMNGKKIFCIYKIGPQLVEPKTLKILNK